MVVTEGYIPSCECKPNIHDTLHHHDGHMCPHEPSDMNKCHHPYRYSPTPGTPVQANLFTICETIPYLVDHTKYTYGTLVSVANDIETRIVDRRAQSCLSLDAVFDLTRDLTVNSIWEQFLEQIIMMNYEDIKEILSMVKSTITFRMYYKITDNMGGEIVRAYCDSPCQSGFINPTEIEDYFISSYKNIFTDMIVSVPYVGMYNFTIVKVDAIIDTSDIRDHLTTEGLNPYYAFTSNNSRINVIHSAVQNAPVDEQFVLATCDVNKTFVFQSNVTTKVKVNYAAYLSNLIYVPNTLGIWNSLFRPNEVIITELEEKVDELTTTITSLTERVTLLETQRSWMYAYVKNMQLKKGDIVWNTVGELYQVLADFTTDNTSTTKDAAFAKDLADGRFVVITHPAIPTPPNPSNSTTDTPSGGGSNTNPPTTGGDSSSASGGDSSSSSTGDETNTTNPPTTDEDSSSSSGTQPEGGADAEPTTPPSSGESTDDTTPTNPGSENDSTTEGTGTGEGGETPGGDGGSISENETPTPPTTNGDTEQSGGDVTDETPGTTTGDDAETVEGVDAP